MIILSEENTRHMSNEELLMTVMKEYADPANWESYEKDMGSGKPSIISPVCFRDKGLQAQHALALIARRTETEPPCHEAQALRALLELHPTGIVVSEYGIITALGDQPIESIASNGPNDFANLGDDYWLYIQSDADECDANAFIDAIYCGNISGTCVVMKKAGA